MSTKEYNANVTCISYHLNVLYPHDSHDCSGPHAAVEVDNESYGVTCGAYLDESDVVANKCRNWFTVDNFVRTVLIADCV